MNKQQLQQHFHFFECSQGFRKVNPIVNICQLVLCLIRSSDPPVKPDPVQITRTWSVEDETWSLWLPDCGLITQEFRSDGKTEGEYTAELYF